MSNSVIDHNIGLASVVANYTTPRFYDYHHQVPQFNSYNNYNQNLPPDDYHRQVPQFNSYNNYNQNLPPDIVNHMHYMQAISDSQRYNPYLPNFHGHIHNTKSVPLRNGNIPMHQYHNSPHMQIERSSHTKPFQDKPNNNIQSPSLNHPSVNHNLKTFANRDGVGHGHGWGHGNVGNSPAISALALLGFLFFLNLIQNSLQNNRMMLTTTTTTTTTNMTTSTAGGSSMTTMTGRNGRERQKRDSDYYSYHRDTPDFIPSHPIRPIQHFLENKERKQPRLYLPIKRDSTPKLSKNYFSRTSFSKLHSQFTPKNEKTLSKARKPFLKRLKRVSTNCIQLFACNFGRGVIKKYGKPTAAVLQFIGKQLLPRMKPHWSTRVLRALTNGWKIRRKCNSKYKCSLDNFFGISSESQHQ